MSNIISKIGEGLIDLGVSENVVDIIKIDLMDLSEGSNSNFAIKNELTNHFTKEIQGTKIEFPEGPMQQSDWVEFVCSGVLQHVYGV